jgi:hypothetical protein
VTIVSQFRFSGFIVAACVLAGAVGAQESLPERPALGTWSVSPYLGAGRHSPAGYNWGSTPDRDHLFFGVHFATPVLRAGRVTLMYAPNATPFVMISNNPRYKLVETGGILRKVESGRGPVFGAGLAPFGLQGEVRLTERVAFYSMAALGGAWFTDYMPRDGARRFNFSIEFGGGTFVRIKNERALQIGYKFHHFSNMYTARENPGLDGHVFYLGLRWQKRLPR